MRVRFGSLMASVVVAFVFAACTHVETSAPDGLFFPTVPRQEMYPSALFEGRLVQRSGCLLGSGIGKAGIVLLWPDGYTATIGQDGRTEVSDENGTIVGKVGDDVSLGGGIVGASLYTDEYQRTPEGCGHHYWLVAPS